MKLVYKKYYFTAYIKILYLREMFDKNNKIFYVAFMLK